MQRGEKVVRKFEKSAEVAHLVPSTIDTQPRATREQASEDIIRMHKCRNKQT